MNPSVFILKGYKTGEKNNSSGNIRFAAKTWYQKFLSKHQKW